MTITAQEVRLTPGADPFSLDIAEGAITGLSGLERGGQAEFLSSLCGLHRPASMRLTGLGAEIERSGVLSQKEAFRNGIAYLPRDRKTDGILASQSVISNFSITTIRKDSRLGFISGKKERSRYEEYRERLGIVTASPNSPIRTLSGGNQQKVLLARWLAAGPRVLLLNDPSRGVDHKTKLAMHDIFRELAEEGATVIVLSSEIEELLAVAQTTHVFRDATLSRSLSRSEMSRRSILDAMFGVSNA